MLTLGATASLAQPAFAAAAPGALPGAVEPGRDRPLPEAPPSQPDFDFSIPAPSRSPVPRAVDDVRFQLKDIQVTGPAAFAPDHFRPLYQNLIGREISLGDIFTIAEAVEQEYRRAGYILARAYVPPQRVADGIFTINVIEGFVAGIAVEGGDAALREYIEGYLQPILRARPLDLKTIERALLLVNDLPGVTVTGVLRASPDIPGASELLVTVLPSPIEGGAAVDNRGSRLTGKWTLSGDIALAPAFTQGAQLAASVASSTNPQERIAAQVRYRMPIGTGGMMANLIGIVTRGQPGSTLAEFHLLTDSWAVGPRLSYPVLRSRAQTLVLDAGLTIQDARVRILDEPFSHDEWRVLDFGVSYVRNGFLGGAWTATADLAQGLPVLDPTPDDSPVLSRAGASTTFTKLVAALRHSRTLLGAWSATAVVQGQYGFAALISGEQVAFGGSQIGRGYEPGAITGDHGLGGSVELRYSHRLQQRGIQTLQPYVYFDAAKAWFRGAGAPDASLASSGGGIRFFLERNIAVGVEMARTLAKVPGSDDGKLATKGFVDASVRF